MQKISKYIQKIDKKRHLSMSYKKYYVSYEMRRMTAADIF